MQPYGCGGDISPGRNHRDGQWGSEPKPLLPFLLCITVGLFTRFFAAAVAIEMGYLTFIQYWHNGYGWRKEGYEYVLMWGMLAFIIALRGGGPYSLYRKLGREL
jgi:uncharacterized membrane protein YphA (DoxX/SURF4 family)